VPLLLLAKMEEGLVEEIDSGGLGVIVYLDRVEG